MPGFPGVGELFSGVVDSSDVEGPGLLRVDDLLDSAVDRIDVVVVTDAGPGVFPAHADVAVPFRMAVALETRGFEEAVVRLPRDFDRSAGGLVGSIIPDAVLGVEACQGSIIAGERPQFGLLFLFWPRSASRRPLPERPRKRIRLRGSTNGLPFALLRGNDEALRRRYGGPRVLVPSYRIKGPRFMIWCMYGITGASV